MTAIGYLIRLMEERGNGGGVVRQINWKTSLEDMENRKSKELQAEAASGKGCIFHKFSVRNSGASSGDVRKLRI